MTNAPIDWTPNRPNLYQELSKLQNHLAFGKLRREAIRKFFTDNPSIAVPVNCSRGIQLKDDRDLRNLLKTGFLIKFTSFNTQYVKLK